MTIEYAPGVTGKSATIQIVDDNGKAVAGLVAAGFPPVYYQIAGNTAVVAVSLSDLALITTAHADGGVKELAGSAGFYRFDIVDLSLATAGKVKYFGEAAGLHFLIEAIDVSYPQVDLRQIIGTSISETTPGNLAASFKKLLDVSSPTGTLNSLPGAVPGANGGLPTVDANNNIHGVVPGTGTGQLNPSGGVVPASLVQILGTALTETAGLLAGGFKKLFNIASPASSLNDLATATNVTSSTATILGTIEGAILNSNVVQINGVSASGVTTVNPVIGTPASPAMTGTQFWALDGNGNAIATESDLTAVKNQTALIGTNGGDSPNAVTAQTQIAELSATAGMGVDVVTITVNDGVNPIQNATVAMTINASIYTAKTNSSGVASLSPTQGAATYGIAIKANGYQFTPTSLIVTGTTSQAYSMTAISITPSPPPTTTCYIYVTSLSPGAAVENIPVSLTLASFPKGSVGIGIAGRTVTVQTDIDGLAQFPGVAQGIGYTCSINNGSQQSSGITGTGTTTNLASAASD